MNSFLRIFFALSLVGVQQTAFALSAKDDKVTLDKVDDFTMCTQKYAVPDCMSALDTWLEVHPTDIGAAAKLVRLNTNSYNAVPYYQKSFAQKQGDCKDSQMLKACLAALDLGPKNTLVPSAKSLAFDTCFTEWQEELVAEVDNKSSHYLQNTCPDLMKKNALSSDQKKLCK